jgi:hypothetical protein
MGHLRLGRLPKSLRWQGVVALLSQTPSDVPALARATLAAAEGRFRSMANDPVVGYCFWLLSRVTYAARGPDFRSELESLGLSIGEHSSTLGFASHVANLVRGETARYPESGHAAELASLALRSALSETIGQAGRSLFGSSVDDLQAELRRYSTDRSFGIVSRRFFADIFARTLRSLVEREQSNFVGPGQRIKSIDDSQEFASALDLHARQSARIVEDFASGWYGKHNWESGGAISREEAQRFVAIAMRKLRMELASVPA